MLFGSKLACEHTRLPLHEGLVQSLLSWWGPLHSAQPCTDALQRLCLSCVPVLQVTLHLDQSPHSDHWPSTGKTQDGGGECESEGRIDGRKTRCKPGNVMPSFRKQKNRKGDVSEMVKGDKTIKVSKIQSYHSKLGQRANTFELLYSVLHKIET